MKKPPVIVLPELPPHWHPPGCDCEPARPYLRVSKVGDREEVKSPAYQLGFIVAYAKRENLRLLPPVCDIDKSGRSFRKRSVDTLIGEVKAGKYARIVLWKWSRWARNVHESTKYVHKVISAGGRVDSATEDHDQKTAMGRFQFDLNMRMDQLQSELISESWVSAHERRREAGLPHGGRARFGYDYIKIEREGAETEKRYVRNEEQATLLAKAYEAFNKGTSFNQLVVRFNASGLQTTLGGSWTAQGVARMMDTGFAAGLIRERSHPLEVPSNSIASYDVWRVGAHEAIIDLETWKKYKAIREARAALPPRLRRAAHALSGLLYCAVCRRRLVTKYAGAGRTHQWQCAWQKSYHPGVAVTVNNRLTLDAVREWVRAQFGSELPTGEYRERIEAERRRVEAERESEHAKLGALIAAVEDKIEGLIDLAETARGKSRERINARLEQYEAELERLTKLQGEVAAPERRRPEKDRGALTQLDAAWDDLMEDLGVMNGALSSVVSRIEVSPRSASSTRKSVTDRVLPVGVWEAPELGDWLASRSR